MKGRDEPGEMLDRAPVLGSRLAGFGDVLITVDSGGAPGAGKHIFPQVQLAVRAARPGVTIVWTATPAGSGTGQRYRFSVGPQGGPLAVLRDYSSKDSFEWTPVDEGVYDIKLTVAENDLTQVSEITASYAVRSRQTGSLAAASVTRNSLVFLYSAPPCDIGQVQVMFRALGAEAWTYTPWRDCKPGKSLGFYVAGMLADTTYELSHQLLIGDTLWPGPILPKRTGLPNVELSVFSVLEGTNPPTSQAEGILLQSVAAGARYGLIHPVATDFRGNVLWYYKPRDYENPNPLGHLGDYLVRPITGGSMLLFSTLTRGLTPSCATSIRLAIRCKRPMWSKSTGNWRRAVRIRSSTLAMKRCARQTGTRSCSARRSGC